MNSAMTNQSDVDNAFQVDSWVHFLGGIVERRKGFWKKFGGWETRMLSDHLAGTTVEKPVYIAGLARSGTTKLLEVLDWHPDVVTHRYRDFPLLYTPYLWNRFLDFIPRRHVDATERTHKDGILVTPDSPEAFEEVLWMAFFPGLHDPTKNSVLDATTHNPDFETFYRDHIRKLLLVRGGQRYISKDNYNITRLEYLLKIFPTARFVIPVRDPAWHIASLMKQHQIFCEGQQDNPRAVLHLQRVGHFEFGLDRRPINADNHEEVGVIQELWEQGREVEAWARYWNHTHAYVADRLEHEPALREAAMVVGYEELCRAPAETVAAMFQHCGLSTSHRLLRRADQSIHFPGYYHPNFSRRELDAIHRYTGETAARFGLKRDRHQPRRKPVHGGWSGAGAGKGYVHQDSRGLRRMPHLKLWILVLVICFAIVANNSAASQQDAGKTLFDRITEKAESMAEQSYAPPGKDSIPRELADLSYQQYRDIRFKKDHALWKGKSLFSIELFHLGFLYHEPVVMHEVIDGRIEPVSYDPDLFDYGDNKQLGNLNGDLGFAGFRVHFPINREDYHDEVIAFLGASYFRMVGAGQSYGLSARGLAVNTAMNEGEEFPRFTEFWLVRPGPDAATMTFYALLDSESVVGAYRFDLTPGADTVLDVKAQLFARKDIRKLGVAPLTSMFMYGENTVRFHDDYRPEVHDSDGLLMHTGEGEWIWRPLDNGRNLRVTTLTDRNPRGFGLVQRDRDFDHYLDMKSRYQDRPSHWVSPRGGDWGQGEVELVEIPSKEETNDNIVAFWTPEKPFKGGGQRTYDYRLRTFGGRLDAAQLAAVQRTRIGWGAIPGSKDKPPRDVRQFVVDFSGGELGNLDSSRPVQADLSTTSGEIRDVTVERLPGDRGWRVAYKLIPRKGKPADMRMFLKLDGRRLTETWNYVWNPNLVE